MNQRLLTELERQRTTCFDHVSAMLSVLEEFESGLPGVRTAALGRKWPDAKEMYDQLKPRWKLLLYLGVVCHDIYKPFKSRDHAVQGAHFLKDSEEFLKPCLGQIHLAKVLGAEGCIGANDVFDDLVWLVKYHEFLGNFFTGEQTLASAAPIVEEKEGTA